MAQAGIRRVWRTINVPAPAVGADFVVSPDGGTVWRLISMVARFVTDATVATRLVDFLVEDANFPWWAQPAPGGQIQATTGTYVLHTGVGQTNVAGSTLSYSIPVQGLLLRPGNRLRSTTALIQAGDQWSRINLLVEEIPWGPEYWGDELLPPPPIELG